MTLDGSPPIRRLVLFAHFDQDDRIKPAVHFYLKALRPHATALWFVSTSRLPPGEQDSMSGLCDRIHLKENIGLDFGMWQQALEGMQPMDWDEILLANSSVLGPFRPLEDLFSRIAQHSEDFIGLTESFELDPHLQSYFLLFRSQVFRHPSWLQFWGSILPFENKRQIIRSYELGLTHWFRQQGFKPGVLFPHEEIRKRLSLLKEPSLLLNLRRQRGKNASVLWPDLLLDAGCPFLKIAAFRENPGKISLSGLRRRILALGFSTELLEF